MDLLSQGSAWARRAIAGVRERTNWVDGLALLLFATMAMLIFLGRWRGDFPFVRLDTDSGQIASFAAAKHLPDHFARDVFLSDGRYFDFYATIQVPFTRALYAMTGDFGFSFLIPLPFLAFLQLTGFYVLGRVLFRERLPALLLPLCTLAIIPIKPLGTYWGLKGYTTPRDWFQAFLPFLLAAALYFRTRPRAWFAVMVGMGLLMYVHPVSTPPWALAVWASIWLCLPNDWPLKKRVVQMFAYGLTFLATTSVFVVVYLRNHVFGATAEYGRVMQAIKYRFAGGYSDIPGSAEHILAVLRNAGLLFGAALGVAIVVAFAPKERRRLAMIAVWCAGLVLMAMVVPVWEHKWALKNEIVPFEYDLIRVARYLIPLLTIVTLWPLVVAGRHIGRRRGTAVTMVAGLLFAGLAIQRYKITPYLKGGVDYVRGKPTPKATSNKLRAEALLAARELTEPGATFIAAKAGDGLALRYFAARAVVYNWKDGGSFVYSDHAKLLDWYAADRKFRSAVKGKDRGRKTEAIAKIGRQLGADYALLNFGLDEVKARKAGVHLVMGNRNYTIVELGAPAAEEPKATVKTGRGASG